jgi:hypothetical protein
MGASHRRTALPVSKISFGLRRNLLRQPAERENWPDQLELPGWSVVTSQADWSTERLH